MTDVDPAELDLATLSWLAGSAANEHLLAAIRRAGHLHLRISHGYVFQMLIGGPTSISDLAQQLGMTQQGASKVVAELKALGYLTVQPSSTDRRIRHIALSRRGEEAVEAARSARAELDTRLLITLNAETMAHAKRALAALLDATGGMEATRQRRVRAPDLE